MKSSSPERGAAEGGARPALPADGATRSEPSRAEVPDVGESLPDLFRAAIETISEGVVITTADLDPPGPRIVYVNPGFTRMTGYAADEVIGKTPRVLQGPATSRNEMQRLRAQLEAGGSFMGEAVNYRKDGTPYILQWQIDPIRDGEGRIVRWLSVQRDVTRQREAEAAQRRLSREVDHRAKNALALVQGIVRLSRAEDPAEYAEAVQGRVDALARAHTLLSNIDWQRISLRRLFAGELAPFGAQITIEGPDFVLASPLVQPIALLVHEMVSNARRHGALSTPAGRVEIEWTIHGNELRLQWRKLGGPPPSEVRQGGFGAVMIRSIVERQLRGLLHEDWRPTGLVVNMRVPLARRPPGDSEP